MGYASSVIAMAGLWEALRYSRTIHKQCRPPEPTFNVDQIPDLSGKVMIVTGASSSLGHFASADSLVVGGNAGIGRETVKVSHTQLSACCSSHEIRRSLVGSAQSQCHCVYGVARREESSYRHRGIEGTNRERSNLPGTQSR